MSIDLANVPIPPEFAAEEGWAALPMPRSFGDGRSFVSGDPEGDQLRVFYFLRESDNVLCAKVWFGMGAEGPPGHAHGGSMAAVLDDTMGCICWVLGHPVVAAEITIGFQKSLPLEKIIQVETSIDSIEGKKIKCIGRIFNPENGDTYTTGKGLFIKQPLEKFGDKVNTKYLGTQSD